MSINPQTGGDSYVPTGAPLGTPRPERGVARDSGGIIDPKVRAATEAVFVEPGIGMIQHAAHAHTFGNYLKATCETVVTKRGSRAGGEGEGDVADAAAALPGLVRKYDYQPSEVDLEALDVEIDAVLTREKRVEGLPLAQRLVFAASEMEGESFCFPQLHKMKAIADQMVRENNGFLLPGGASIHPKFYGETPAADDSNDYTKSIPRSVMEFCIINACKTQGKPLLGICRGHQAIAVYDGGVLDRDTMQEHQEGKIRSIEKKPDTTSALVDLPTEVYFDHHQVVTRLGKQFESIVDLKVGEDLEREYRKLEEDSRAMMIAIGFDDDAPFDEMPEVARIMEVRKSEVKDALDFLASERAVLGMESRFGAPIIGLQFHPEAVQMAPSSPVVDKDTANSGEEGIAPDAGVGEDMASARDLEIDREGNTKVIDAFVKMAQMLEAKQAVLAQIRSRGMEMRLKL